jgi:hypothetical protein
MVAEGLPMTRNLCRFSRESGLAPGGAATGRTDHGGDRSDQLPRQMGTVDAAVRVLDIVLIYQSRTFLIADSAIFYLKD